MVTVAQLIEYLQTVPQDAEVLVLTEKERNRNIETIYESIDLPVSNHVSVVNFQGTVFIELGKTL